MFKLTFRPCQQLLGITPGTAGRAVLKRSNATAYNLVEVGRFTSPKASGNYDSGQLFLHEKLECRGVILFPWVVRIFNRNNTAFPAQFDIKLKQGDIGNIPELTKASIQTMFYYQAMFDFRDCRKLMSEGVTFLSKTPGNTFNIRGIDYISHDDVQPYDQSQSPIDPIDHHLFRKFFKKKTDPSGLSTYHSTPTVHDFQENKFDSLRLRDVHCETTNGVKVTVYSFYMGCQDGQEVDPEHWWRYNIMIENVGDVTVQLKERTWCIFSNADTKEKITGRGVVGKQPRLEPGQCFQYSSRVNLKSTSGHMWGTYLFEREDRNHINVSIPPFSLCRHAEGTALTN